MNFNPHIHHRRSIRLKGYDYSQEGLYFITICAHHRQCLFGNITDGEMILNDAGKMIDAEWLKLTKRFQNIALHEYVLMPNHFHGILEIAAVRATLVVAPNDIPANNVVAPNDNPINNAVIQNDATINVVAPNDISANNVVIQNDIPINAVAQNISVKQINKRATTRVAPTNKTIGDMMDAFKSITTVQYINGVKTLGWQRFTGKIWQRNYYEHIIRNEQSYQNISDYIVNNPSKWNDDKFYMP